MRHPECLAAAMMPAAADEGGSRIPSPSRSSSRRATEATGGTRRRTRRSRVRRPREWRRQALRRDLVQQRGFLEARPPTFDWGGVSSGGTSIRATERLRPRRERAAAPGGRRSGPAPRCGSSCRPGSPLRRLLQRRSPAVDAGGEAGAGQRAGDGWLRERRAAGRVEVGPTSSRPQWQRCPARTSSRRRSRARRTQGRQAGSKKSSGTMASQRSFRSGLRSKRVTSSAAGPVGSSGSTWPLPSRVGRSKRRRRTAPGPASAGGPSAGRARRGAPSARRRRPGRGSHSTSFEVRGLRAAQRRVRAPGSKAAV